MNKESNKFDEIVRERFSSKDFPFDEENWEQAEQAIDLKRKKEKQRRVALIFVLGMCAGIAIMLPFVKYEVKNNNISEIAQTNEIAKPSSVNKYNLVESKSIIQEKNISGSVKRASVETQFKLAPTSTTEEKIFAPAHRPSISKTTEQKTGGNKNESAVASDTTNLSGNSSSNTMGNIKAELVIENNMIKDTSVIHENGGSKTDAVDGGKTETSQPTITEVASVVKDSSVTDAKSSSTETQQGTKPSATKILFSVDAGTNYIFGWNNGSSIEGRGFNPVLGIGATRFLNAKWALYTGVQYASVINLSSSKKTFTTLLPDFGESTVDTTISTRWIHYALVPVFVQYHFNSKNSIEIGGSVSYLLTTTNDLTTNKHSDFRNAEHSKITTYGYVQGFNPWNASLAIGYTRRITNRFNISAEGHYGLLDIKDDSFFSSRTFERSTGIKLLISYYIFNY